MSTGVPLHRGFFFPRAALTLALLAAIGGGTISALHAELTWKQKTVELHADAKSTVLEARFAFTNTGTTAVEIAQVESSCGCTTVALEKRHYEPLEAGEIVARYTVGVQVGEQKKTVQVITNDGQEPTILTLDIYIPEVVRIKPPFVTWKHGEPLTAKTITLEMLQEPPAREVSAQSSAVNFAIEIKSVVPGRKYELTIRPKSSDQQQFSTLTIQCRFGDEEKTFRAYATVRPPEIKD